MLVQVAQFTYNIYAVPDNLYGVYDHQTEEWNGIVRELIDRKADIAVAPMTINFARWQIFHTIQYILVFSGRMLLISQSLS